MRKPPRLLLIYVALLVCLLQMGASPSTSPPAEHTPADGQTTENATDALRELLSRVTSSRSSLLQSHRAVQSLRSELDGTRSTVMRSLHAALVHSLRPLAHDTLSRRTPALLSLLLDRQLCATSAPLARFSASTSPGTPALYLAPVPLSPPSPPSESTVASPSSAPASAAHAPSSSPSMPPSHSKPGLQSQQHQQKHLRQHSQQHRNDIHPNHHRRHRNDHAHANPTSARALWLAWLPFRQRLSPFFEDAYLRTMCTLCALLAALVVFAESRYSPPALLVILGGVAWLFWLTEYPLRGAHALYAHRSLLYWVAAGVLSQQGVLWLIDALMRFSNVHSARVRQLHGYLVKALEVYMLGQEIASVQLGLCSLDASLLSGAVGSLQAIVHASRYLTTSIPLPSLRTALFPLVVETPHFVAFQVGKRLVFLLDYVRYLTA
jgi:hypothetical protein